MRARQGSSGPCFFSDLRTQKSSSPRRKPGSRPRIPAFAGTTALPQRKSSMGSSLKSMIGAFYRLLDIIMVASLALMLVLVFTNVVLRMGFNTGIDVAEELPRFAFVWLSFVGGVVGMYRRTHL